MKNNVKTVESAMPPNTAVPSERRGQRVPRAQIDDRELRHQAERLIRRRAEERRGGHVTPAGEGSSENEARPEPLNCGNDAPSATRRRPAARTTSAAAIRASVEFADHTATASSQEAS